MRASTAAVGHDGVASSRFHSMSCRVFRTCSQKPGRTSLNFIFCHMLLLCLSFCTSTYHMTVRVLRVLARALICFGGAARALCSSLRLAWEDSLSVPLSSCFRKALTRCLLLRALDPRLLLRTDAACCSYFCSVCILHHLHSHLREN